MIADVLAVRWETLFTALFALVLAVWAFRVAQAPPQSRTTPLRSVEFQVLRPGAQPEVVQIRDSGVIGRGRECAVVFDDATVSKLHAKVSLDGNAVSIEDLDSTNGTLINGARVEGKVTLALGDRIGLGANQIVYLGAPPEGGG